MKNSIKIVLLSSILIFLISNITFAKTLPNDEPIIGFKVEDVPFDDGGGLILSWNPLHKDKKIIEYCIYRGVNPDTLFYIGKIPVNVKTGVVGDTMRYTDQGYTFFVDATSMSKLKKEKGQRKGEIGYEVLYREIPRDMNIYAPLMKHYKILCVIPNKDYFYKTKMREFTKIDTTKDGIVDTTSYIKAGLKLEQFKYILSKLKPETEYYYAIQAVNYARKASPLSEIVSGIAVDNPPEKLKEFYAVAYTDAEKMHFEWTLPAFSSDQKQFNIYLYDEIGEQHKIFSRPDAYPYTPQTNAIVTFDSIKTVFPEFNQANMKWYRFNIGEQDRANQETLALEFAISTEITTTEILPQKPDYFTIEDNPNDKGDQLRIYFGKPFFGISKLDYNEDFSKLHINYFIKDNSLFEVKRINIYINNNKCTEYVLDNKAKMDVDWDYTQPTVISATFDCKKNNEKLPENFSIAHKFYYDDEMKLVRILDHPEKKYNYQIYKVNPSNTIYRFPKILSYIEREYLDKINYEENVYRGIPEYKFDDKRLYCSTYLDIGPWEEQIPYYTSALYLEQVEKNRDDVQDEISNLKEKLVGNISEDEKQEIEEDIENYTKMISEIPPILQTANEQKSDKARMKILEKHRAKNIRSFKYFIRKTDGKGHFVDAEIIAKNGEQYFFPISNWFNKDEIITLIAVLIFGTLVFFMIKAARTGKKLYIRPIAGIEEIDNALGRATEMGKPILFVPGLSGIRDVATLAGLAILSKVAKKAAEYDTKILVPIRDYIVLPIAQEIVKEAHYEAGRPDSYDKNSVFFISTAQFAFVAGVNGIMMREKTATNFYMGMFWAESLLMTETGTMTGAIQIAGTDAVNQLPFFITTCDYTLIGEELYAASAYLSKQPLILGTLKAQDYVKLLIVISVVVGTLLSTVHLTFFMNWFPTK